MYVCICHAVTEPEVRAHVEGGAHTEEEVGLRCGAGTGCGMCVDKIAALIDQHHSINQRCGRACAARILAGLPQPA